MTSEEVQALGKRLNVEIANETIYRVKEKDGLFYYEEKVMNEREFKRWIKTLTQPARIHMRPKEVEEKTMISDRIKRLTDKINAAGGSRGHVYVVKYLDGAYSCKRPEMAWTNEEEFAKWSASLPGNNVFIIDDI